MLQKGISKARFLSKTTARAFSSSQNIVNVDFKMIQNNDKAVLEKIEEAYNDDGLGVMVVNNIPGYAEKRQRLLPLAQKLAQLPEDVLKSLECPEYSYSLGWSHGKEKFMGVPDMLKGSYYANPCYDAFVSTEKDENGNRIKFENKWPKEDLPELQPAFQE